MIADIIKRITQIGLVAVLVLGFVNSGFTQVSKEKKPEAPKETKKNIIKTVSKEIAGEVTGISKNFIAVAYKREKGVESEMTFAIEGIPNLERIKNLEDIQLQDTVIVGYEESTEIDEEGKEFTRRVAKTIKFVKPAPPVVPPQAWEESTEP